MAQQHASIDHEHPSYLGHHYDTMEQQHGANTLGMWAFLVTEVLLFGGMFAEYFMYRAIYPQAFIEGSHHNNLVLGSINTIVLLLSSFLVALGVRSTQVGNRRLLMLCLAGTIVLGAVFLGIKGAEYYDHYLSGQVPGVLFEYEGTTPGIAKQVELFLVLYFTMTATHALHMIIGMAIMGFLLYKAWQGRYGTEYFTPVELGGLYWHFVDLIWVLLFPMLYLISRHG